MNVKCAYCGNVFDAEKNESCPSCGGQAESKSVSGGTGSSRRATRNSSSSRSSRKIVEQQAELDLQTKKVVKYLKIGCLTPIVLIIIAVVIMIALKIAGAVKSDNKNDDSGSKNSASYTEQYEEI